MEEKFRREIRKKILLRPDWKTLNSYFKMQGEDVYVCIRIIFPTYEQFNLIQ